METMTKQVTDLAAFGVELAGAVLVALCSAEYPAKIKLRFPPDPKDLLEVIALARRLKDKAEVTRLPRCPACNHLTALCICVGGDTT